MFFTLFTLVLSRAKPKDLIICFNQCYQRKEAMSKSEEQVHRSELQRWKVIQGYMRNCIERLVLYAQNNQYYILLFAQLQPGAIFHMNGQGAIPVRNKSKSMLPLFVLRAKPQAVKGFIIPKPLPHCSQRDVCPYNISLIPRPALSLIAALPNLLYSSITVNY